MEVEQGKVPNPLLSIFNQIPGTNPALVDETSILAYADLKRLISQMAALYQHYQLPSQSRVMIMVPDSVAWVVAYLGAIWAGLIPVGINPRVTPTEFIAMYQLVSPSFIVAPPNCQRLFENIPHASLSQLYLLPDNQTLLNELATYPEKVAQDYKEGEELLWVFTSGSSGQPKAIVHHAGAIYHSIRVAQEILGITSRDKLYASSRLFFAYPLANVLFAGIGCGASIVLHAAWPNSDTIMTVINQYRPTIIFSIPTLYRELLKKENIQDLKNKGIRYCVSAGENLSQEFEQMWREKLNLPFVNGYGMSETLSFILYRYMDQPPGMQVAPGVTVHSSHQNPQRLCFSHPGLYRRQLMPEKEGKGTEIYISDDIFIETVPQRFTFQGRADFLFKINGRFVHAIEEENYLLTQGIDILQDAAVICEHDKEGRPAMVWCVVINARIPFQRAEEKLIELRENLPSYRQPIKWCYYSALPRTSTGKLLYRELKECAFKEEVLQK